MGYMYVLLKRKMNKFTKITTLSWWTRNSGTLSCKLVHFIYLKKKLLLYDWISEMKLDNFYYWEYSDYWPHV